LPFKDPAAKKAWRAKPDTLQADRVRKKIDRRLRADRPKPVELEPSERSRAFAPADERKQDRAVADFLKLALTANPEKYNRVCESNPTLDPAVLEHNEKKERGIADNDSDDEGGRAAGAVSEVDAFVARYHEGWARTSSGWASMYGSSGGGHGPQYTRS
jgi:hypothetical protein